MGWMFVGFAAISEIIGVVGLKLFSGRKTFRNAIMFVGGFALSFVLLYQSFHYLQLSVAYAVWVGVGTAGAVLINMLFFGESKSMARVISLMIIIIGVTGLKAVQP